MLAVPMSFGPLFIQPTNSLAIWLGGKLLQEIQEITFEIGMRGQYGPDIYDPPGDARPAGVAGEDLLGAGTAVHHVRRLQEDRAGDGIGVDLGEKTERLSDCNKIV